MHTMAITVTEDSFDKVLNPRNLLRLGVSGESHSNWGMVGIMTQFNKDRGDLLD